MHNGGLLFGRHNDGAPSKMIGFSKEAAGALMDGSNGGVLKDVVFHAG